MQRISREEVSATEKQMKSTKAAGPDVTSVEVWRCPEERAVGLLVTLFNTSLRNGELYWCRFSRSSVKRRAVVTVMKLMSHNMKIWETAVEAKLRRAVIISEQAGWSDG